MAEMKFPIVLDPDEVAKKILNDMTADREKLSEVIWRGLRMRWIPCSERMPESIANRVLCFCKGNSSSDWIGFGHMEMKDGISVWLNLESHLPFEAWDLEVTHWMPLPEPPESEVQQ